MPQNINDGNLYADDINAFYSMVTFEAIGEETESPGSSVEPGQCYAR